MSLGVVVHLRQMRDCWFVAVVQPREDGIDPRYRWIRRSDGGYGIEARWDEETPINLEVGWRSAIFLERLSPGEVWTVPTPYPDEPGHVLWYYDDPAENVYGAPLSPPPRLP